MDPLEVLSKVTDHLWDMKQKQDELDDRIEVMEEQRRHASQQLRALPKPGLIEVLAAMRSRWPMGFRSKSRRSGTGTGSVQVHV